MSSAASTKGHARFRHEGAPVFVESAGGPPLVDFVVQVRGGALKDPAGAAGTTRVMARLLRRGWRGMTPARVDEALDRLGARLSITLGQHSVRVQATALARNFDPVVALVARLLREPAFRGADLARAKRRIRAGLHALQDDDHGLADRHLRRVLHPGHALGQPVGGTARSMRAIGRQALVDRHAQLFVRERLQFGVAGAASPDEVREVLRRHFRDLPSGPMSMDAVSPPTLRRGRQVRVIDKRERAQTQLGFATLAPHGRARSRYALMVADAAFGGMFTSRLSAEIRTRLGYSYSTYSQLHTGPLVGTWEMWSHPSVEHAYDCAARQLELLERWHAEGPTKREVARAKQWLVHGRCFEEDTAAHRLDLLLAAALRATPKSALRVQSVFRERVQAVDVDAAQRALRRGLRPSDLAVVAVGDARKLVPALERLAGVASVEVVPPTADGEPG